MFSLMSMIIRNDTTSDDQFMTKSENYKMLVRKSMAKSLSDVLSASPQDLMTLSECEAKADEFVREESRIIGSLREPKYLLREQLKERISTVERAYQVLKSFQAYEHKLWMAEEKRRDLELFLRQCTYDMDQAESLSRQAGLFKIMLSCTDRADREVFWTKYLAYYGTHMVLGKKKRTTKTAPDNPKAHSQLPTEIMAMIYDCADLETCVNLRETSSAWYSVFHQINLRSKLASRNPWITPQDDFTSWSDCVLVFVARLKTWQFAGSLDNVEAPANFQARETVFATNLERDEHLPTNFRSLMGNLGGLGHSDLERIGDEYMSSDKTTGTYKLVSSDDDKTVIQIEDLLVTLPPEIKPSDIADHRLSFLLTPSFVMIQLVSRGVFIVPRDNPHFENGGFCFRGGSTGLLSEIGGTVFQFHAIADEDDHVYGILDPESREMVWYTQTLEYDCGPSAFYNGLVWWGFHLEETPKKGFLLPTFIDLADPETIYYKGEKAITGLSRWSNQQGDRTRGMAQLVVSRGPEKGLQIVDLASGIVTDVLPPTDWPFETDQMVVGFVGDENQPTFQARILTD